MAAFRIYATDEAILAVCKGVQGRLLSINSDDFIFRYEENAESEENKNSFVTEEMGLKDVYADKGLLAANIVPSETYSDVTKTERSSSG